MGDKSRSLCKWGKDEYRDEFKRLSRIVKEPKHVCLKCGRAAKSKKHLCKPGPL